MSSWKELCAELAACERQIVLVRNQSDKKVSQLQERERLVGIKQEEVEAAHKVKLQEALEEHERHVENLKSRADQDIAAEAEAQSKAELRAQLADAAAEEAEKKASRIQKQIQALNADLDMRLADAEQQFQGVRDSSDNKVLRVREDSDEVVRAAALFASEVREEALAIIGQHQELAKNTKEGLLAHSQPGMPQLTYSLPGASTLPLSPRDSGRPRSVERFRERAMAQKALALEAWGAEQGGDLGRFVVDAVHAVEASTLKPQQAAPVAA